MTGREARIWCVRDTLSGVVYTQPNRLIAEKVAEMHGHCEVFEQANAPTDDERERKHAEICGCDLPRCEFIAGWEAAWDAAYRSILRRSEVPEPSREDGRGIASFASRFAEIRSQ